MSDRTRLLLAAVTAIYLILPEIIFALGWLRLPLAVLTIILCAIFIAGALRDVYSSLRLLWSHSTSKTPHVVALRPFAWIALAAILIVVWLCLSGAGGAGYQNDDYRAANALFKDLVVQDWPLITLIKGQPVPVAYYMFYYLPAAVVGRMLGWLAANVAVFVWTLMGIVLSLIWFLRLCRVRLEKRGSRIFGLTLLFCLAGGLDYIGEYVWNGTPFHVTMHVEWWAEFFQYSSNTTLVYWVPQHTIGAWLITGLVVDSLYDVSHLKYLGMAAAALVLWSPFGAIGVLPFLLLMPFVYLSRQNRGYLFNRTSALFNISALWIGGVNLLFLRANQASFPKGPIWRFIPNRAILVNHLVPFWFLEIGLLALLILLFLGLGILLGRSADLDRPRRRLQRLRDELRLQFNIEPMQLCVFSVSMAVLTLLPLYRMGAYNDFMMRVSIPSLFVFWAFVAKVVVDASMRVRIRLNLIYSILLMVIIIGFFPAGAEIARSVKNYHFGPPALTTIPDVGTADPLEVVQQRVGSENAFFFRYMSR